MRRRTDQLLMLLLLPLFAFGLGGTLYALWAIPNTRWALPGLFVIGTFMVQRAFGEPWWSCAIISAVITTLVGGAWALDAVFGSFALAYGFAAAAILLVLVILMRSLIAGGSADYPYED